LGFFLDKRMPGRHEMELELSFCEGKMTGEGRDKIGAFVIVGTYSVEDGKATFDKTYVGRHTILYSGFNEGKGIWGTWLYRERQYQATGGFHIWPKTLPDPTQNQLKEEAEIPDEIDFHHEEKLPELVPG
jgi:hypothetical protein